jgi:RNA polymerase sigma factor (sigma-70 family)
MKKDWTVTQEAFDRLLMWLDSDRKRAGDKYEEIRFNLIRMFARRGCNVAEELADETITRVTCKVIEIADNYVGDPRLYFYGVAHNVYMEYIKPPRPNPLPPPDPGHDEEKERRLDCLDECMKKLDPQSREMILEYYQDEKKAKIDHRKKMAERLGITLNTLRMRTHRIKLILQECVEKCLNPDQKQDQEL